MAGNSSALTERSFGVPDGINNGQFGAGPVIDFFGLSSKFSNFPVEFVYPETTAIVPANIALISGAKNTGEGRVTARETNKVSLYVDAIGELHIPVNGEAPEDDVIIEPIGENKMSIINYKGFIIKGYMGRFYMKGPKILLQMGVEAGIGSKNSQGLGCVKII